MNDEPVYRIVPAEMLAIMRASGALDDLDINDEDFLDGHHRANTYIKVMEAAYALGSLRVMDEWRSRG